MRPCSNQLSGGIPALTFLFCAASFLLPLRSAGQPLTCTGTSSSTKYSAVFNGNGNNTFMPAFPQYSPPAGYSLVSAVLNSTITINATLQVTNPNPGPVTVKIGVSDEDNLTLNGSDIFDVGGTDISDVTVARTLTTVTIPASGNVMVGPTLAFNNTKMISDSLATDNATLNSFIGSGTLNLAYSNSTGYTVNASVNVTPAFQVTTNFSLTYYYCYSGPLAADLLTFTAIRENNGPVKLEWWTANEQSGRVYDIETSTDGKNFVYIDSRPSDPIRTYASYSYDYPVPLTAQGKLYFRLKRVDRDGTAKYSQVKRIELPNSTVPGFSLYPTPASDFVNIQFNVADACWQVDVIAADGRLVQREYYHNTRTARLNFHNKLAAGAYFVRAIGQQTAKSYTSSFLVR